MDNRIFEERTPNDIIAPNNINKVNCGHWIESLKARMKNLVIIGKTLHQYYIVF